MRKIKMNVYNITVWNHPSLKKQFTIESYGTVEQADRRREELVEQALNKGYTQVRPNIYAYHKSPKQDIILSDIIVNEMEIEERYYKEILYQHNYENIRKFITRKDLQVGDHLVVYSPLSKIKDIMSYLGLVEVLYTMKTIYTDGVVNFVITGTATECNFVITAMIGDGE